jgi:hypothetical protein
LLFLEPSGDAVLQNLTQHENCTIDPNSSGRTLLLATINLAKKYGAKTFELMDISTKKTASGAKFILSDMYFLTTGKTWYQSIIPSLEPYDPQSTVEELPIWKERVENNTWAEVASRMPSDMVIPVDISDVDINAPGSAMAVLNRIKQVQTDFFPKYEKKLLVASGVSSLYGVGWRAPLS